jgi:hypothetical protein
MKNQGHPDKNVPQSVSAFQFKWALRQHGRSESEEDSGLSASDRLKLDNWRQQFEAGDSAALFHAVSWCAFNRRIIPDWAALPFCGGWERYKAGIPGKADAPGKSTLGGVFGIVRPSNFKPSAHRRRGLAWEIYEFVEQEKTSGIPVDEYLFERAAEKVSGGGGIASWIKRIYKVELPESESRTISGKTAQRIYYEFLARMARDKTS